jgi:hypothetical protein
MAHVWCREDGSGAWQATPLQYESYVMDGGRLVPTTPEENAEAVRAELYDVAGLWVLLAPESVRVSGTPVFGGVRVLRDLDEIRVGPHRAFFSTEEVPQVVSYAADDPLPCGRCRQPLVPGEAAVRCGCGVWHHQSEDLPCWTYADHCSQCDRATALDAPYRWSPTLL